MTKSFSLISPDGILYKGRNLKLFVKTNDALFHHHGDPKIIKSIYEKMVRLRKRVGVNKMGWRWNHTSVELSQLRKNNCPCNIDYEEGEFFSLISPCGRKYIGYNLFKFVLANKQLFSHQDDPRKILRISKSLAKLETPNKVSSTGWKWNHLINEDNAWFRRNSTLL